MNKKLSLRQARKNKVYLTFSSMRYIFVSIVIGLIGVGLLTRLAYIQVVAPSFLSNEADKRSLRVESSIAHRGNIKDRNGEELAVSVPAYAIWVDPKVVKQKFAFTLEEWEKSVVVSAKTGKEKHLKKYFYSSKKWPALAEVLEVDLEKLAKTVKKPGGRFIYLKRQVNVPVVKYIKQLKLPGVASLVESHRFYPTGEINANLIGLTNIDSQGIEGIEQSYNNFLQGKTGKKRVRKDRLGNVIDNIEVIAKKKSAGNLQLSIDQRIQSIAYRELKRAVKINDATSGALVMMDVNTGEIYAMVNYPSFNPNDRSQYKPYRIRNRALTDTFEPGSIVKPFVVASALIYKKAYTDEVIDTSPGWMHVGGGRISDSHNYGKLNLANILKKSSNMGVSKLALRLKPSQLEQTFSDLGLGNDTGIGLLGESIGSLPLRHNWSDFELSTMSFGYGVTATTLQLANAYAILGNGGRQIPVSILKNINPVIGDQVIPNNIALQIIDMMVGVTQKGGTGTKAQIEGYKVAGKTGTSRKAISGGYGDDYVVSFGGIAPASKPKFAIAVMINSPKGDRYSGGSVAAPVFANVMKRALRLSNVRPDDIDTNYTLLTDK